MWQENRNFFVPLYLLNISILVLINQAHKGEVFVLPTY